jgi:DNA topoisomerase-1
MTAYWTTLSHNGVAIPDLYQHGGLSVRVNGKEVPLSPLAEEMAYHLAKKKDTPYIKDPVFASNFMKDFVKQLPAWCKGSKFEEVDFSEMYRKVDREKKDKETMSKEGKKSSATDRKTRREALKAKFGFAQLDGERVEIANWLVEPPGLYMGRGAHPLRGHWKPRVTQKDIVLNLGEKEPAPEGQWKELVHDHNSMWIAKWIDKLTGKEKYVWLHESTPLLQSRNREKYEAAMKVGEYLPKIKRKIQKELSANDPQLRQIATVCYLIDEIGLRVGDEKDEDEADTVGATTLRVEHVKVNGKRLDLDFIGKDSVPWSKTIEPPPVVLRNIEEFTSGKKPSQLIFEEISSNMVNRFLSKILTGLTAKVFRTHHATAVAETYLKTREVREKDGTEKLYEARLANLDAAKFCNHQRAIPKNWAESLEKKKQKLNELQRREKKDQKLLRKLTMEIDLQVKTKNYNLNTSLKNYIDPRVFKSWSDYVGLDWTRIYTASMQRKFAWVTRAKTKWEPDAKEAVEVVPRSN